jgi:hypothetical protein
MSDKVMDTRCMNAGELSSALKRGASERLSPGFPQSNSLCRQMRLSVLATQCLREIDNYRRGKPFTDRFSVELLRRAIVEDDHEARSWVQHCFDGLVRGWLCHHPRREAAYRLESEETYVALAFDRFWQAYTSNQRLEFNQLATALQYLRSSLHGIILDTLRTYARSRDDTWPEPGEQHVEDSIESDEVWEFLKTILPNQREQRVAYLLFHCGLGPREILCLCPREWRSIDEVCALRRTIMERFLLDADHCNSDSASK